MMFSLRSVRVAAAGAVGAGALTGAMLFTGIPAAAAAPAPTTSFATFGPHGVPESPGILPDRPGGGGHGWGGGGHGGIGRGWGGGHGGFGRGWGGRGGWGHGWDHRGRGGWGHGDPFFRHNHWWNWWW